MTQYQKIVRFLENGGRLTAGRARSMGITNLSARVAELRAQGHVVYTNYRKNSANFYTTGRPTKAMVSLAYAVAGSSTFN